MSIHTRESITLGGKRGKFSFNMLKIWLWDKLQLVRINWNIYKGIWNDGRANINGWRYEIEI